MLLPDGGRSQAVFSGVGSGQKDGRSRLRVAGLNLRRGRAVAQDRRGRVHAVGDENGAAVGGPMVRVVQRQATASGTADPALLDAAPGGASPPGNRWRRQDRRVPRRRAVTLTLSERFERWARWFR